MSSPEQEYSTALAQRGIPQENPELNLDLKGNQAPREPHRQIYYQLKDGIYFVPGIKRGAICDTRTGNVYSINESAKQVLLGEKEDLDFTQELAQMGLIDQDRKPEIVETETPKFQLEFVWFEIISDDCNERCLHCYADSMPPTYRNALGLAESTRENKSRLKLAATRWKELIKESYDLGCRQCQLIGGEPFLWRGENKETVLDLATYAREVGYEFIEIFTNTTMVTPEGVERIKTLGLHIAVSLYSDDEKIHDAITRTPGSFKKTVKALERLREAEIPTRVETVLMRLNQGTVDSTNQFIAKMDFQHRRPDVLRPKGRGDNPELQPDLESLVRYGFVLCPDFSVSPEFFQRSAAGHNCLAGKITITDNGNVLPCIFSRDQVVGSIRQKSLKETLEGKIKQIWHTTKDDVLICQDCEYRYVCFDCRPISQGASCGNGDYKTAPYPRCTYNPYDGEWAGGIWKLDEQGNPYYDETLALIIEKVRSEGANSQPTGHS